MEIIIIIFVLWNMSKILRIEHICKSLHVNDLRTHMMLTFIYKTEMMGLAIGSLFCIQWIHLNLSGVVVYKKLCKVDKLHL